MPLLPFRLLAFAALSRPQGHRQRNANSDATGTVSRHLDVRVCDGSPSGAFPPHMARAARGLVDGFKGCGNPPAIRGVFSWCGFRVALRHRLEGAGGGRGQRQRESEEEDGLRSM